MRVLERFIAGRWFVVLFCVAYAGLTHWLLGPGLLYTDSVSRWNNAISISTWGLSALHEIPDVYPVLPELLMAGSYRVAGGIGLFALLQAFAFPLVLFALVRRFVVSALGNVATGLLLVTPTLLFYSNFVTYDSLCAIFLGGLCWAFLGTRNQALLLVPLLTALMVGTRLNAVAIVPLVLVGLYVVTKRRNAVVPLRHGETHRPVLSRQSALRGVGRLLRRRRTALRVTAVIVTAGLAVGAFQLPRMLGMPKANWWAIGVAWEYADMASRAPDTEAAAFLESFGTSPAQLAGQVCYSGIWCGQVRPLFIDRGALGRADEVLAEYLQFARRNPRTFIVEKAKFQSHVLGISAPLDDAEIARWREPGWADAMLHLGFASTPTIERLTDAYFRWSSWFGWLYLRPWLIIVGGLIAVGMLRRQGSKVLLAGLLPVAYYSTFLITAQNVEFRYSFPMFFAYSAFVVGAVSVTTAGLRRRHCAQRRESSSAL